MPIKCSECKVDIYPPPGMPLENLKFCPFCGGALHISESPTQKEESAEKESSSQNAQVLPERQLEKAALEPEVAPEEELDITFEGDGQGASQEENRGPEPAPTGDTGVPVNQMPVNTESPIVSKEVSPEPVAFKPISFSSTPHESQSGNVEELKMEEKSPESAAFQSVSVSHSIPVALVAPSHTAPEGEFPLPSEPAPSPPAAFGGPLANPRLPKTDVLHTLIAPPPQTTPEVIEDVEILGEIEETIPDAEPNRFEAAPSYAQKPSTDTSLPAVPQRKGTDKYDVPGKNSPWKIVGAVGFIAALAVAIALYFTFGQAEEEEGGLSKAKAHYAYGNQMMATNDVEGAIAEYGEALKHNDSFAEAYLALGVAYTHKQEPEKAREYYEKFLALAPNHTEAKKVRELLKNAPKEKKKERGK